MRLARRTPRDDSPPLEVGVIPPPSLPAEDASEQLFLAIYERTHDRAMFYAERLLSHVEAEDAFQSAMGDLWENWKNLRPDQRTDAYFFGILHHKVSDALKVVVPLDSLEDAESQLPHHATGGDEPPTRATTADEVLDLAVAAMPPKRREVYLLLREQDLSYKEVARTLRVSEGTVNTHIRYAMEDVRAKFTQMGFRIAEPRNARLRAPSRTDAPSDLPPDSTDSTNV